MAREDQKRWNEKHAGEHAHDEDSPSRFLKEIFESTSWTIEPGRTLDLAAGKGRNAIFLAARGFRVDAMDISAVALEEGRRIAQAKGLEITFIEVDLDRADLPEAAYDLIVNFNFLERALIPKMKSALKPGGHIVFETFLVDQKDIGHPTNPAYLLGYNELLDLFRDFRVLFYREGKVIQGKKESFRAGLFARKRGERTF
jgi:tellurite methyltransferase